MTYQDEVWTTQQGKAVAVGDLHPEHMRNILRMILRKRRAKSVLFEALCDSSPQLIRDLEQALMKARAKLYISACEDAMMKSFDERDDELEEELARIAHGKD